jgi:hypothetical protein
MGGGASELAFQVRDLKRDFSVRALLNDFWVGISAVSQSFKNHVQGLSMLLGLVCDVTGATQISLYRFLGCG